MHTENNYTGSLFTFSGMHIARHPLAMRKCPARAPPVGFFGKYLELELLLLEGFHCQIGLNPETRIKDFSSGSTVPLT